MTTLALRKKLHKFIDESEGEILNMFYDILKNKNQSGSLLSSAQKKELDRRSELLKKGKMKTVSLDEFKKRMKSRNKLK